MKALIAAAREKAGHAIHAARELAGKIREAEAAGTGIGDLEAQFGAASTDAEKHLKALQRLEREAELGAQHEMVLKPELFSTGRVTNQDHGIQRREMNAQQRRDSMLLVRERESFQRAGVSDMEAFKRFKDAHAAAFLSYVLMGAPAAMEVLQSHGFKPQEAMALISTSGDLGGFLVPDDVRSDVLKDVAGKAVMRGMSRVEQTGSSVLVFPTIQSATTDADMYTSGYVGAWRAEGYLTGGTAPTVQNAPKFGQNRIPVHVWAPNAVEISQELIGDSGANVEGIVTEVIAETKALDEDAGFLNGSGVSQPLGLMNTVSGLSITAVNSGSAAALTYDGLVDLFVGTPSQYRQNASWLMNSLSLGAIMKLKDGMGEPLFPVNAIPGQLFGKPMVFSEFMPDISAGTYPIVFGDFKHYGIADRADLRIQRLTERFAPNIGILPTARVGGQILRTAAFRKQYVSA